jgi:hypothetical protein
MAVQVAGGLATGGLLQDLGQARRRIQHIGGGNTVHGLGHAVARAVLGKLCCQSAGDDLRQPIGVVIGIATQAVVQQVAVVVPGVGLPVDAGQAVGCVVLVVYHAPARCQAQAVADGVIGVGVIGVSVSRWGHPGRQNGALGSVKGLKKRPPSAHNHPPICSPASISCI